MQLPHGQHYPHQWRVTPSFSHSGQKLWGCLQCSHPHPTCQKIPSAPYSKNIQNLTASCHFFGHCHLCHERCLSLSFLNSLIFVSCFQGKYKIETRSGPCTAQTHQQCTLFTEDQNQCSDNVDTIWSPQTCFFLSPFSLLPSSFCSSSREVHSHLRLLQWLFHL